MENYISTSLPPRKRLLAGSRSSPETAHGGAPQSLLGSSNFTARLIDIVNSAELSDEEVVEATRAVSLSAAEAAAAARAAASAKAAVAAKARAAAKAALELLELIAKNEALQRPKPRVKHVPVKAFYKAKQKRRHTEDVDFDAEDGDIVVHSKKRKKNHRHEFSNSNGGSAINEKPGSCANENSPSNGSTLSNENTCIGDQNVSTQTVIRN